MIPFREQGCDYCREKWIYRSDQPGFIGEADGSRFYRCALCRSYWELGFDYPSVVDRQRVLAMLGTGRV
ncbi:MAG: hypothetical protein J0I43_08595 [Microbacterium sp.]|uniref:hypothetical protein n=1 Tax=Microbacterium sp. TaxID=51671 RepID=UPI001AC7FC69|nr:hypothetical protein [Microbacterium sp.]MBN9177406.1 hypothetical protein [Microbacterium sp.]